MAGSRGVPKINRTYLLEDFDKARAKVNVDKLVFAEVDFAHPYVMSPRRAKEFLFLGEKIDAAEALRIGMINRVVPRASLEAETASLAARIAQMPRFGLLLAKKAINQAEDRMGMRDTMDSTFALHHVAHAHNALTSEDHLKGENAKTMAKSLAKSDPTRS